ncbi:hypothetical protein L1049_005028 [Liquidambar formosana]|uniref:RPA-interacting protein n=1 Tax=Liquidambar formosana TaxID=63359 RepID=A0AAP0WYT8_LIQFO
MDDRPPTRRPSLRTYHYSRSNWKDRLRENCYKRVREDRRRLLWKMRLPTDQSMKHKEFIKSAFQDIVSDELKKIKDSSLSENSKTSNYALEDDDTLWEFDGLHNAFQGECEEIMLEMQRIFYEDFRAKPTRRESEDHIGTWEDEEDEYLARAVYEHMQLSDKQVCKKETWCPICKQGALQENSSLIYCTLCELQLNKGNEVSLDLLQTRLADALAEHLDHGCRLKPKFCIETRFGLTALYILCQDCSTFEVII